MKSGRFHPGFFRPFFHVKRHLAYDTLILHENPFFRKVAKCENTAVLHGQNSGIPYWKNFSGVLYLRHFIRLAKCVAQLLHHGKNLVQQSGLAFDIGPHDLLIEIVVKRGQII